MACACGPALEHWASREGGDMLRRTFLASGAVALGLAGRASAQPPGETWEAMEKRLLAEFPFERITVPGKDVLSKWEELRKQPNVTHVIAGTDYDVVSIAENLGMVFPGQKRAAVADILAAASKLKHPDHLRDLAFDQMRDLLGYYETELAGTKTGPANFFFGSHQYTYEELRIDAAKRRDELKAALEKNDLVLPELGEWPDTPEIVGPTELINWETQKPVETACIIRLPTSDWTEVPAYLGMGGWNACPAAEHHVAAFRSWRDRYGAELVRAGLDTVELRVKRRPQTREEALALAEEMYLYCEDILVQGYEGTAPLAASLMASDWWYFWWD